jgi:TP901 family phage tail tape measure protein
MGLTFTVTDNATGEMAKIRTGFQRTSKAANQMNKGIGQQSQLAGAAVAGFATAAGAAGLAVAGKAAGLFGKFEQGIKRIGAISGATPKELKELSQAALQAGLDTQFSPVEATEGLANLAQMGFNARESMNLLGPALDFAAGGGISIAQGASTAASAIKAFSLEGKEATGVADKLLKISNLTALSAGDLELAIGTVARGAGAAGQSLDEMLPAMGLVKNTGVDASVAASSVSSALLMVAKNGKKFKGLGVDVTDASGKFRPFLDIVAETNAALSKDFPDAGKRAAKQMELFGKFGLTSANAIGTQLNKGIKGTNGELLKGADAISFMRSQMAGAEGTAKKFREAMLDNLEGQKTLLKGSVETLGVVAGEPLSKAIRPMVEGLIGGINKIIQMIQKMPPGLKEFISKAFLAASAVLAVVGAVGGAILAASAMGITMGVLKGILAAVGLALIKVAAVVGIVVLVFETFKAAYEQNLGGFADFVNGVVSQVKLVWTGLTQIFTEGALSGEILKPENEGLRNFLAKVAVVVAQAKAFWNGLKEGFGAAIQGMQPQIEQFVAALKKIGAAFGFLGGPVENVQGKLASATGSGSKMGAILGAIGEVVLTAFTLGATAVAEFARVFNFVLSALSPVTDAIGDIFDALGDLVTQMGLGSGGASGMGAVFEAVGGVLGTVFVIAAGIIGGAIRGIVTIFRAVVNVISGVVNIIAGILSGDWSRAWSGAKQIVFGVIQAILGILETAIGTIAGLVDAVAKALGKDLNLKDKVRGVRRQVEGFLQGGLGVEVSTGAAKPVAVPKPPPTPPPPALQPLPAAFTTGAAASISAAPRPQIDTKAIGDAAANAARAAAAAQPPLVAKSTLNVDGATLGEIVTKHTRDGQGRAGANVEVTT